jgi:trimeric autotransporter adhesin
LYGSGNYAGVYGVGTSYGVVGSSGDGGTGVDAYNSSTGDALFAYNQSGGYAAFFDGNVDVDGNLSKAAGSFKIDDPLDPANKYLYHSFVESPDMMNIYNGNVTTDAEGNATVQMPDWFEALNRDFRYQLTVIGQFAEACISSELENRQFSIKTNKPNVKVSWQITGIRQDAWANAHRIPVEADKAEERGYYMHPELFGAPEEKGIPAHRHPGGIKPTAQLTQATQKRMAAH